MIAVSLENRQLAESAYRGVLTVRSATISSNEVAVGHALADIDSAMEDLRLLRIGLERDLVWAGERAA